MGQFEINSSLKRDLVPDKLELSLSCVFVSIADDNIFNRKDGNKAVNKAVDELGKELRDCEIAIKKVENRLGNGKVSKKGFLSDKEIDVQKWFSYVTISVIVNGLDSERLMDIFEVLNDKDFIESIEYTVSVSNIDEEISKLKVDLGAKCKKEASDLLSGLDAEIVGVEKVVYNSSGSLLYSPARQEANAVCLDACFDDGDLFDIDDSDEDDGEGYSAGIVSSIMSDRVTISDSITVMFEIK